MPMKVAVWGINYAPELTGIAPYNAALCGYLRSRGHEVEMVTTFAYYPAWRKLPEDRGRFYRTDPIDGVLVHRCWHYVPEKVSAMKRIVHEGSFAVTSFFRILALWFATRLGIAGERNERGATRWDVLVVVSPPLLLGAAAWLIGLLTRVTGRGLPFVFHVQDLQPDAALGLGMLKPGMLTRALYGLEALAYRAAARVSGISHGMMEAFASKGVPPAKRVYFPNPVVLPDLAKDVPARGAFRRRHGFEDGVFLAVYSGNLGVKQGLRVLIDAAAILNAEAVERVSAHVGLDSTVSILQPSTFNSQLALEAERSRLRFVICGDGAERESLSALIRDMGLEEVIQLLPLQARAEYEQMLVDADVCLITQQAGSGRAFFPSKLLTTLAFARPVLTVADPESELVRAMEDGGFGVNVPPGEPEALARTLQDLAAGGGETLTGMGSRGWEYVGRFASEKVFGEFEEVLQQVSN